MQVLVQKGVKKWPGKIHPKIKGKPFPNFWANLEISKFEKILEAQNFARHLRNDQIRVPCVRIPDWWLDKFWTDFGYLDFQVEQISEAQNFDIFSIFEQKKMSKFGSPAAISARSQQGTRIWTFRESWNLKIWENFGSSEFCSNFGSSEFCSIGARTHRSLVIRQILDRNLLPGQKPQNWCADTPKPGD